METFNPDDNQKSLSPVQKLIDVGTVDSENVDEAKTDWKEKAEEEFQELIEAEVRD